MTCPHAQMICGNLWCHVRHLKACTEVLGLGGCPANFGEWGAWRAVVNHATAEHALWMACLDPDPYDCGNSSIYAASRGTAKRLLDAAGWSP